MIGIGVLLLIGVAFFVWDRRSPASTSPDMRLVWAGVVLAALGVVTTVMFWWLYVPIVVLLVGASLIVIGRHRPGPHVTA
jgi:peptidoglycan/LPS O-acetylase OafA/YrhL